MTPWFGQTKVLSLIRQTRFNSTWRVYVSLKNIPQAIMTNSRPYLLDLTVLYLLRWLSWNFCQLLWNWTHHEHLTLLKVRWETIINIQNVWNPIKLNFFFDKACSSHTVIIIQQWTSAHTKMTSRDDVLEYFAPSLLHTRVMCA